MFCDLINCVFELVFLITDTLESKWFQSVEIREMWILISCLSSTFVVSSTMSQIFSCDWCFCFVLV